MGPMAPFQGTVIGTERLLEAMKGSGVRRLLLASSISVYDWKAARGALTEESPLERSPYTRDGYAIAKIWQERLCRRYADEHGIELVVLRPGFIWGAGNERPEGSIGASIGPCHLVFGVGRRLPFTHVVNAADCFRVALENDASVGEVLNLVDGHDLTAWRFEGEYLRRMGLPFQKEPKGK